MKTYCVADLHGRADLLYDALLMAAAHSNGEPARFVCTGDMIDRGPESAKVIEMLRQAIFENLSLIALQGNHESMMVEVLGRNPILPHQLDWWTGNGGAQTMISYGVDPNDISYHIDGYLLPRAGVTIQMEDDIKWLKCLPTFLWDDPHRVYVHGGMMYGIEREFQDKDICQWVFLKNKTEDTPPFEGRHVVHGHAQYKHGPIRTTNRTNLDTYAWKYGRLAMAVFDDDIPGGPQEILWVERN